MSENNMFRKVDNFDYSVILSKAFNWVKNYTIPLKGIVVCSNSEELLSYPEVTGYYIPTLLKYGKIDLAKAYAEYLLSIQNPDGSWNDPSGTTPYTFDTGMILKGLVSLHQSGFDSNDAYVNAAIKGADWILSMQRDNGSISTPDYSQWNIQFGKQVPESIHVYCLSPIKDLAAITGDKRYTDFVDKALSYYLAKHDLTDFSTLSHFNAYIIEGLIDVGEIERAKRAMDLISLHQRLDGSVPAYSFADFVCSTGLFQYAICWFKLGEFKKGQKAFAYAANLQNESGGWFGSYSVGRDSASYFPDREISWAVKYFLDALYYGNDYQKYKNADKNEVSIWDNLPVSVSELALEYVKDTIAYLKSNSISQINLYGAGEICKALLPLMADNGIAVDYIFDRNAGLYESEYPSYKVIPFSSSAVSDGDVILITSLGSKHAIEKFILSNLDNKKVTVLKLQPQKSNGLALYFKQKALFDLSCQKNCSSNLPLISLVDNPNSNKNELLTAAMSIPALLQWGLKDRAVQLGNYIVGLQNKGGYWTDILDCNEVSVTNTSACVNALYALSLSFTGEKDAFTGSLRKALSYLNTEFEQSIESFFAKVKLSRLSELYCDCLEQDLSQEYNNLLPLAFLHRCMHSLFAKDNMSSNSISSVLAYEDEYLAGIEKALCDGVSIEFLNSYEMGYCAALCENNGLAYLLLEKAKLTETNSTINLFYASISWFKLGNLEKGEMYLKKLHSLLAGSSHWSLNNEVNSNGATSDLFFALYIDILCSKAYAINAKTCEALTSIAPNDGRYLFLKDCIRSSESMKFLDLGCGKLRYTKKLLEEKECIANNHYYGVDFTLKIMSDAPDVIEKKVGTILNIPYEDNSFDFVFLSESLEHAIDIDLALKEISRVLKSGGKVIVIDKDDSSPAKDTMADFEQWFSVDGLSSRMKCCGFSSVVTKSDLTGDQTPGYNFTGWVGTKE